MLFAACGGGGEGGTAATGSTPSTTTFPLQNALKLLASHGLSTNFTISGDCNGSGTLVTSAPSPATYEGTTGFASTSTSTLYFSDCAPSVVSGFSTEYYTSDFLPLGSVRDFGDYSVYRTLPVIPATVRAGDKGTLGKAIAYSSGGASSSGYDVFSYSIEPETDSSVTVDLVNQTFTLADVLVNTERQRYRLTTAGDMTLLSVDIREGGGSSLHLILTAVPDTTAPTVAGTSPANLAVSIPADATISATFTELLDPATLTAASFTLNGNGGPVAGTVSSQGSTVTFTPSAPLVQGTTYSARIAANVEDLAGNPMAADHTWTFTTIEPDLIPPTIQYTIPPNGAGAISTGVSLAVMFSEAMAPATVTNVAFTLKNGATPVPGTVALIGENQAVFTPNSDLSPNTTYTATVSGTVRDLAGNPIASNYAWTFSTFGVDSTPPAIVSTNPANAATGVDINARVSVNFSEQVDPTGSTFTLTQGGAPVAGSVSTVAISDIAFTPSAPLAPNTLYTATISGAMDAMGNRQVGVHSWNFTTDDALFMNPVYSASTVAWPEAVAVGDVNGDGRNDVVVTTSYSSLLALTDAVNAYKLYVYLQNAGGGLNPPIKYATHSSLGCRAMTVAIGDINRDGKNDVVLGNSDCAIEVFTQNASGNLDAGVVYASGDSHIVRLADMNNDGRLDVVGVGWGANTISIWYQNGAGNLDAPTTIKSNQVGILSLAVGDIDNDGRNDIVFGSARIGVLTQAAGGNFNAPIYLGSGSTTAIDGLAIGDVNGDHRNDIVATSPNNMSTAGFLGVLTQNGTGGLNAAVSYPCHASPSDIEIVDVTGDGLNDIVAGNGVYRQLAGGSLKAEKLTNVPSGAVGDVNNDGKYDMVGIPQYYKMSVAYHY